MTRRAMHTNGRRTRGHTMVELAISTGILATIAGGIFALMQDSQTAFGASLRNVKATQTCDSAMRRIRDDVEMANATTFTVATAAVDGDILTLQVPLTVVDGVVTWGGRAREDGVSTDYPDATIEYAVIDAPVGRPRLQLVRRVRNPAGVAITGDELVADDVDEPDGLLGKGFTVVRNGRIVTTTIRVRLSRDDDRTDAGEDLVKAQTSTFRLRNP